MMITGKLLRSSRFHKWMTILWAIATVPTVIWLRESVFWVSLMSLYAIVISHWGAMQAARAEETQKQ